MWARHGFLTFNVLFYLSINTTTLLLGTVLTYAYSSGKAYYEGTHLTVRFPKWVRTAGGIFFAMTLVLANVIYAVAMRVDRFWYTGLFLLWLAVMLLCIGLYALGVTFQVTDALDRLATGTRTSWSAQETSKKIQKIKRRGYLVFGLLCVAVIFQLMASIARLSDRKATFEYPDNTTFDLNDRYFHYLQYFATALCLWASWMPLKGDGRYDRLPSNKW